MTSCEEVSRRIASDEFAEAGWWQRLVIRFHLLRCRHCRRYEEQIRSIGSSTRQLFGAEESDPAALERLERDILGKSDRSSSNPDP